MTITNPQRVEQMLSAVKAKCWSNYGLSRIYINVPQTFVASGVTEPYGLDEDTKFFLDAEEGEWHLTGTADVDAELINFLNRLAGEPELTNAYDAPEDATEHTPEQDPSQDADKVAVVEPEEEVEQDLTGLTDSELVQVIKKTFKRFKNDPNYSRDQLNAVLDEIFSLPNCSKLVVEAYIVEGLNTEEYDYYYTSPMTFRKKLSPTKTILEHESFQDVLDAVFSLLRFQSKGYRFVAEYSKNADILHSMASKNFGSKMKKKVVKDILEYVGNNSHTRLQTQQALLSRGVISKVFLDGSESSDKILSAYALQTEECAERVLEAVEKLSPLTVNALLTMLPYKTAKFLMSEKYDLLDAELLHRLAGCASVETLREITLHPNTEDRTVIQMMNDDRASARLMALVNLEKRGYVAQWVKKTS